MESSCSHFVDDDAGLRDKLLSETANGVQLAGAQEGDHQFLYPDCFIRSEALLNRLRAPNECPAELSLQSRSKQLRHQGEGLLIRIGDGTHRADGAPDALIVASGSLAMLFEHSKLVCSRPRIAKHVTGIPIMSYEVQGDLLAPCTGYFGYPL